MAKVNHKINKIGRFDLKTNIAFNSLASKPQSIQMTKKSIGKDNPQNEQDRKV